MKALIVLLVVAMAGGVAGVAIDRAVLLPRMFGGPMPPPFPAARNGPPAISPEIRRRISERMTAELALTPSQHLRVDSLMAVQFESMQRAALAMRPTLDSLMQQNQRALDSVLTPVQRAKLESLRTRMQRRN
jgi:hypothetical protein